MKQHERVILALTGLPGIGAQKIRLLLGAVQQPEELFDLSVKDLTDIPGVGPNLARTVSGFSDWNRVDRILERTEKASARLLSMESEAYPELLRQLPEAPLLLWVKGDPAALNADAVAVIGTRNPSSYGRSMTEYFVRELVAERFTIVSGLAYGIDTEAHRICVEHSGSTVAVLGSGIDRIYPNANIPLAHRIIEQGGAIISEFPPGSAPDAGNFPVRNRIVSGLSLGALVVESGRDGGSMITARISLDQSREVFAIPHPLNSAKGEGCNYLIQSGQAKLVQYAGDVLEEINPFYAGEEARREEDPGPRKLTWEERADLDDESRTICRLLSDNGPLHIDNLSDKTGLSTEQLLVKLLELEFLSCVRQQAGKHFEAC